MSVNKIRKLMFSTADKEASYDAGATVDSLIRADADNFIQEEVVVYNDKNSISGVEEGTGQEKVAQHVTLTLSAAAVRPHTLAFLAAMALGTVTSSLVGAGAYKHSIRPLALTEVALPTVQAEGVREDGAQKKYTGMFANSFEMGWSSGPERLIKASAQMMGSGTIAAGTASVTEKSENILTAANSALWLDETTYAGATSDTIDLTTSELNGAPEKLSSQILDFSYKVDNQVDLNSLWYPGSGYVLGRIVRGERVQTLSLTLLVDHSTQVDRLISQNSAAMQLKVKGAQIVTNRFYGLNAIWPKIQYAAARRGQQSGRTTVAIEAAVYQDGTWPTVLYDVFNGQAAYLA